MNVDEIKPNTGVTGSMGDRSVAVFRDDSNIYVFDDMCPHMRCALKWDPEGPGWGCPCHGSLFSPTGDVVRGPAKKSMIRYDFSIKDGMIVVSDD